MKAIILGAALALLLAACDNNGGETSSGDEFSAPPYLLEHNKLFGEGVTKISDAPVWLYTNVGDGIPNTVLIEGNDGLIIVDTTLKLEDGARTMEMIRERTNKPVRAIVYTHHHADHVGGAAAFADPAAVRAGEVTVIGADNLVAELQDESNVVGPIMGMRALYMYGTLLDPEGDGRDYHVGVGGQIRPGATGFIAPTMLVGDSRDATIVGIRMHFFRTGGESASHMAIWLPDYEVLLSGDEIQGPTFPNLHSLRGTKPRDAEAWITAIDRMRAYGARAIVPSHGPAVEGRAEIERILRIYRDAIQWTHDQAVRLINRGYTGEELAEALPALPPELSISPWTREMYGTVKHSVRNFLGGYISWWDGDPATLDPTPRVERAARLLALMGGQDRVLDEAQKALDTGDPQWAAELATLVIRIDNDNASARALKARAFRRIGYATLNTNWRSFYLTGALELEGKVDSVGIQQNMRRRLSFTDISTRRLLSLMRYRVVPEDAEGKSLAIVYRFTDSDETFTLHLRNQVLVIEDGAADSPNATITLTRALYNDIVRGETGFGAALLDGSIELDGSKLDLLSFLAAFDFEAHPINLVVR